MRTKTMLLSAALCAAGVASSMAASVYSINIVGYAQVPVPAGKFIMAANPLDTGNNVLTNVLKGQPGATTVQLWNGVGFNTYSYSTLGGGHWKNGAATVDNTNLALGSGFFLKAPTAYTNTFVGTVVPNPGNSVTNPITTTFNVVGSIIPYSGVVTNPATLNLGGTKVPGASVFQQWNVPGQKFISFTYNGLGQTWKQGAVTTNPVVTVAEGWFLKGAIATNWVETLP